MGALRTTAQINGEPVEVEMVDISIGCNVHDAPTCLVLRRLDNFDILHIPGASLQVREMGE